MKKFLTSAGFLLVVAFLSIGGCMSDNSPTASTSSASLSNSTMPGPATSGNSSNTTAVNPGNETISEPGTEPPPSTGEPSSTGSTPFNPGSGNITPGVPNQNSTENPGSGGITPSMPGGNSTTEGTDTGSST